VSYVALVDHYGRGEVQRAISELASWLPSRITSAVNDPARLQTGARRRAAVMLHTDTTYALMAYGATSLAVMAHRARTRSCARIRGADDEGG
jgi:hypothetical protein